MSAWERLWQQFFFFLISPNIWSLSQCIFYCSPGCISIYHLMGCISYGAPRESCHHCCVSKDELKSTALKTLLSFLTLAENHSDLYCLLGFDVGLWALMDIQYHLLSKSGVVFASVNSSGGFGSRWFQKTVFPPASFSGCLTLTEWFNCKQTQSDGYWNHTEKNPSGFDRLLYESHVMLILYFTLQTVTFISGHLLHYGWPGSRRMRTKICNFMFCKYVSSGCIDLKR